MSPVTTYRLVRHSRSLELWALRLEADTLTGACGPLTDASVALPQLAYDDHPDDLYWITQAWESFETVGGAG